MLGLNNFNRFSIPRVRRPARRRARPRRSRRARTSRTPACSAPRISGRSTTAVDEPRQRPVDGDLRLGRHRPGRPRPPQLRGRVGPPGRAGHGQELRRTVTPDTTTTARRSSGSSTPRRRPAWRRTSSRETLYFAPPQHRRRRPRRDRRLGQRPDTGRCRASASFGECENVGNAESAILTDGLEVPGDKMLEQAAIEGRTLFSSTGDTGSSCPIVVRSHHERRRDPGLPRPRVAVGQPVGGRGRRHRPDLRRQHAREAPHRDRVGVHRRRQLDERAGRELPDRRRLDELHLRPERQPVRARSHGAAGPICRSTPDVAAISGDVATGNGMLITDDNGADQQGAGHEPLLAALARHVDAHPGGRERQGPRLRELRALPRRAGVRRAATSTTSRSATTSRIRRSPATTTRPAGERPRCRSSCST